MNRDNLIDEKIKVLQKKSDELSEERERWLQVPYKTNLRINGQSIRVASDLKELILMYMPITNAVQTYKMFSENVCDCSAVGELKIYGYSVSDWNEDFKVVYNRLKLSADINAINGAIEQLKAFYSSEKLETEKFEKLLNALMEMPFMQ